jgi:ABC-type multidrug transport system ATPase subunit
VAILRDGKIVGQGSIGELSEQLKPTTTIECVLDGRRISIESERPQEDLRQLFAQADELGTELTELEVRRPNLEDVFLEATR